MSILESSPLIDFAANLTIAFQPILEIDWRGRRLHAVEALARGPAGTELESADALFSQVRQRDQEVSVDRLCVSAAIAAIGRGSCIPNLCVNVHAKTLAEDPDFPTALGRMTADYGIPPPRLTIEVIEDGVNRRGPSFFVALERLRSLGARIAIDDVGSGASNLETV
ncbi:MAG TPA: EAL domain-containing protein, partial [Thermoanaerobaculia bacterium]